MHQVAKAYIVEAAYWCNRVCLGLEYLGPKTAETAASGCVGSVVADWKGGSESEIAAWVFTVVLCAW